MNVAVIGTEPCSLALAACLAEAGHHVTFIDPAAACTRVRSACDPELAELVRRNVWEHRLAYASSIAEALPGTEVAFASSGADADEALTIAREIGRHAAPETVLALRGTVPVGTADTIAEVLRDRGVHVVSNPELAPDRSALDAILCPDRVLVGASSDRAREVMERLYAPFLRRHSRLVFMDTRTAELSANAARAMRSARDAVLSDVAAACARVGADVEQVRQALALR